MARHTPTNSDDMIDSRDIIARISELESDLQMEHETKIEAVASEQVADLSDPAYTPLDSVTADFEEWLKEQADIDNDDATELFALRALQDDADGYCPDWLHGVTLIRDSYFETYAQELAEDIGAINRNASWPNSCIDWTQAAEDLQAGYTSVEFAGVTYWVR